MKIRLLIAIAICTIQLNPASNGYYTARWWPGAPFRFGKTVQKRVPIPKERK